MRNPILINLSADERSFLENLIRTGSAPARVIARARVLLLADQSLGHQRKDAEVAQAVMVHKQTVYNVRKRFADFGLDGALYEKPRPGAVPKITGDIEAQLVVLACSDPPEGHSRWTLQLLADKLVELQLVESISYVAVHRRLKKRSQTLASKLLLHRQAIRQVRRKNGGRPGCISASL
jgi:putative transposase